MTHEMEEARATAIREIVVEAVKNPVSLRRMTARAAVGLAAAITVGVAALAGGTAIAINGQQTAPIIVEKDTGPDFAPIVTIGKSQDFEGEETARFDLGVPPDGATGLSIDVVCLTPGQYEVRLESVVDSYDSFACGTNEPGTVENSRFENIGTGRQFLMIVATPDDSFTVRTTWEKGGEVIWQTNASGETYGTAGDDGTMPDLLRALGETKDGLMIQGYVRSAAIEPPMPPNGVDVFEWQDEQRKLHPGGLVTPLYLSDGKTVIGTFVYEEY